MDLETAIARVLRIKLAAAGLTLSQWARDNGVERKTAAYQFQKGAAVNLLTLQRIAETFRAKPSQILAEAEKLVDSAV